MNGINNDKNGFRENEDTIHTAQSMRRFGSCPVADRDRVIGLGDPFLMGKDFGDVTYRDCDDTAAAVFLMADCDPGKMLELLSCTMAVFARDAFPEDEKRERLLEFLFNNTLLAYDAYCRAMGQAHHDFASSLADLPDFLAEVTDELLMDGSPDDDGRRDSA